MLAHFSFLSEDVGTLQFPFRGCWHTTKIPFMNCTALMDWALKSINPKVISHGSGHRNNVTTSEPSTTSTPLLNLTGLITREDDYPFARGGSADVWKGTLLEDTGKRKVLPEFIFSLFVHVPT
jgi:hypothetical protein